MPDAATSDALSPAAVSNANPGGVPQAVDSPGGNIVSLVGDDDKRKQVMNSLAKQQGERVGAEGALMAQEEKRSDSYRQRLEAQLAAEGATAHDLKPWNAEQEMATHKTDLWSQFGSPGFILGMVASAFSGAPMISALNAGASAMNAINQGDMKAYDNAFGAWKENSALAVKRLSEEHRQFADISELQKTNLDEWRTKYDMLFKQFNDERKATLLANGYDKEVLDIQASEVELRDKMAASRIPLLKMNATMQIAMSDPDYKSGDPKRMVRAVHRAEQIANSGYMDVETGLPAEGKENELPYAASFGLKSSFNWVARKAQDLWSGSFAQPTAEATQSTQELEQLRFRTLNALSSDIESPGRLKMIQERVQDLFPKVESLWTGPAEATVRIKELRGDIINEMKQNQQIMSDSSFSPKEREKAHIRLIAQSRVAIEMNKILKGISERDGSQQDQSSGPWDRYKK